MKSVSPVINASVLEQLLLENFTGQTLNLSTSYYPQLSSILLKNLPFPIPDINNLELLVFMNQALASLYKKNLIKVSLLNKSTARNFISQNNLYLTFAQENESKESLQARHQALVTKKQKKLSTNSLNYFELHTFLDKYRAIIEHNITLHPDFEIKSTEYLKELSNYAKEKSKIIQLRGEISNISTNIFIDYELHPLKHELEHVNTLLKLHNKNIFTIQSLSKNLLTSEQKSLLKELIPIQNKQRFLKEKAELLKDKLKNNKNLANDKILDNKEIHSLEIKIKLLESKTLPLEAQLLTRREELEAIERKLWDSVSKELLKIESNKIVISF